MAIPRPVAARAARLAILLAAGAAGLSACETTGIRTEIPVSRTDSTLPALSVSLANGSDLNARYPNAGAGEWIGSFRALDPARIPVVRASTDTQPIRLLVLASDRETGIRSGQANVTVFFTCTSRVPGFQDFDETDVRLPLPQQTFGRDAPVGSSTSAIEYARFDFTLEDLWTRGGCPLDSGETELVRMTIHYYVTAQNNLGLRAPPLSGDISIRRTFVAVDGRPSATNR